MGPDGRGCGPQFCGWMSLWSDGYQESTWAGPWPEAGQSRFSHPQPAVWTWLYASDCVSGPCGITYACTLCVYPERPPHTQPPLSGRKGFEMTAWDGVAKPSANTCPQLSPGCPQLAWPSVLCVERTLGIGVRCERGHHLVLRREPGLCVAWAGQEPVLGWTLQSHCSTCRVVGTEELGQGQGHGRHPPLSPLRGTVGCLAISPHGPEVRPTRELPGGSRIESRVSGSAEWSP